MLDDLIELATTVVHPDHTPDISPHITGASSSRANATMPPRRRQSKSQSISSIGDANGMLPPATPASGAVKSTRKPRSRSTTSPPGSPRPVVSVPLQKDGGAEIVKFIGVVLLSIVSQTLLQTLAATFLGTGELATVSKVPESWPGIIALLGWRIALLSIYWFGNFDAYDVASLSLLLQTPSNTLLSLFYTISPLTLLLTTTTTTFTSTLPYLLLRPLSHSHSRPLRNRPILSDPYTTLATSLLATAIFAVLLQLSFATFLPSFLITHFATLRTLEPAHLGASGLPTLLLGLLPAGYACMAFLFTPSTAATNTTLPVKFSGATAGFREHVYWNTWGWYSVRQKELIARSVVMAALMFVETVVFCTASLRGVEVEGALGYAGVWVVGVGLLAGVLDWVGGPSD